MLPINMMMILADAKWAVDSISFYATTCVCCSFRSFLTYGVPKPLVFSMIIILIKFGCLWVAPITGNIHYHSFVDSATFSQQGSFDCRPNNGKTLMVVYTWFYQYQHLPTSTNQVGLVFPTCFFTLASFLCPLPR